MKNARHCSMNPLTLLLVAGTFAAMTAGASAQTIQRESTGGLGEQGDSSSNLGRLSPDATRMLFRTASQNWNDTTSGQGGSRIILKNRSTGSITLLNGYGTASPPLSGVTLDQGTPSQIAYGGGTKYAWVIANNFGLGFEPCPDNNNQADIFNSGNPTPSWSRITTPNPCGTQANGSSGNPAFHRNAEFIIFDSSSTTFLSGDNAVRDVFSVNLSGNRNYSRKSVTGSVLTVITPGNGDSSNGVAGSNASQNVTAFESAATNLVGGDTNAVTDIFARVEPTGISFPFTERLSVSSAGVQANAASTNADISKDGRYVVFESFASNLVSGDTNTQKDIFLRDRQTDTTTRLSIAMNGVQANGASANPVISDDGTWVAFASTATNLIPTVTAPATSQVYLCHVPTGGIFAASYNYATNTFASIAATNPSITRAGVEVYVTFETSANNLGGTDTNGAPDIYSYRRRIAADFDDCGILFNPISTSSGSLEFSTAGAIPTVGGVAGVCGSSSFSADVYYRFTAPCGGMYSFDTAGSSFDTVLSLFTECGGTVITCSDDVVGGLTSQISFTAAAGQTFIVRVSGFANRSGDGLLNWSTSIPAPANDNFCNATAVGEGAFSFYNCGATTDGPSTSCVQADALQKDVWFRYTPTVGGLIDISSCGANFDTMIAIHAGTCPSGFGAILDCNDDSCGLSSRVSFTAVAGQPVSIRVGGLIGSTGSGTLVIRPRQCSPADITNTDGDNPGSPDGAVDNGDFSAFFSAFFLPESDPLRLMADIANTDGDTYLQGAGADGAVDNGDFTAFFTYFFLGCPLP